MHYGNWSFDFTGYIIGIPVLLYGIFAKRYWGHPKKITRWVWIGLGIILIAGTLGQNIIEFRDFKNALSP
jgi:hypothetical protein